MFCNHCSNSRDSGDSLSMSGVTHKLQKVQGTKLKYTRHFYTVPPFQLTQQLTDVLNKDLKVSCRWWGSFDLFRRLLFIIVVLIFNYTLPRYTQVQRSNIVGNSKETTSLFVCFSPIAAGSALFRPVHLLCLCLCSSLQLNEGAHHRGTGSFGPPLAHLPLPRHRQAETEHSQTHGLHSAPGSIPLHHSLHCIYVSELRMVSIFLLNSLFN